MRRRLQGVHEGQFHHLQHLVQAPGRRLTALRAGDRRCPSSAHFPKFVRHLSARLSRTLENHGH